MTKAVSVGRSISLAPVLMLALLLGISVDPGAAGAARYDRTCGAVPGQGGYDYVRVANMSCRHGKKVATKAYRKFCKRHNHCKIHGFGQVYRGKIRRNGWKCKVTVGIESNRAKCRKGNTRVVKLAGA